MGLPENIKRERVKRGWDIAELARRAGIIRQTLSKYEDGRFRPKYPAVAALAQAFGCRVEDLAPEYTEGRGPLRPVTAAELVEVPVLGAAQAAGFEPAVEAWDDYLVGFGEDTAKFAEAKAGWFALKVEGTSMMPAFPPGTLLLVAAGEFVVSERGAIRERRKTTVRYWQAAGLAVRLTPENPRADTYHVPRERICWVAEVVHPSRTVTVDERPALRDQPA